MDLSHHRVQYLKSSFKEDSAASNPIEQFDIWFHNAIEQNITESNAMVLSTCFENKPSSRVVLLKEYTDKGFCFFSNYSSRKGKELENNPNASLLFFWKELEQQVRIEGRIEKLSAESSDTYFYTRPKESQIGAIISPQSSFIPNRQYLEEKFSNFDHSQIARPVDWGGYLLVPSAIEFWQGGAHRIHDRLLYTLENEHWKINRLAP
ncbi:MAG: pyridoxamine 5'-phosphate oxidase [Chitinophagales bacterium]|nr:pyridoxamine 5'-phosphate oxidase [Chitinophagales bacterium]